MLNNDQVKYLAEMAKLNLHIYGDTVLGVSNEKEFDYIKIPYEEFKTKMGLNDIRFDWLLTDNVYQAGGAVLNWIWGENKNEDIDFFFTNINSSKNFKLLLSGYGFEETSSSIYATTYFNEEAKAIVQIIGSDKIGDQFNGFMPFGKPEDTIGRFDIELCRFAIDGDYVYFTSTSIKDLINKIINVSEDKHNTHERILKYNRKGFFIPRAEAIPKNETIGWY